MPLLYLNLSDTPVRDLSPLQGKELSTLYLNDCKYLDSSTLAGIKTKLLSLKGVPIRQLADLAGTGATILRLNNCGLRNIHDLPPQEYLQLYLSNNEFSDISVFARIPRVKNLGLNNTRVCDVTPLRKCDIHTLDISKTPLEDLSPLQGKRLFSLDISNTNVTDIRPLKSMPLTALNISGTKITDLTVLQHLPQLKHLLATGLVLDTQARKVLATLPLDTLEIDVSEETFRALASNTTLTKLNGFSARHMVSVAPLLDKVRKTGTTAPAIGKAMRKLAHKGKRSDILLLPIALKYDDARKLCETLGGTLTCPVDGQEALELADYLASIQGSWAACWLGMQYTNGKLVSPSGVDLHWLVSRLSQDELDAFKHGKVGLFNAALLANRKRFSLVSKTQAATVIVEWSKTTIHRP